MRFRLPKSEAMLRREAARWLARLQSARDPDVESKLRQWRQSDPRHAAAFDRVRRSYGQAGLLHHSPVVARSRLEPSMRRQPWQPRPAFAAAAALAVALIAVGRWVSPLGDADVVMLMTAVGEIRQVGLADGSNVTLDTSTRVDLDRAARRARLRYGRARFQIARAAEPFVVETGSATITSHEGSVDIDRSGRDARVRVLAGTADVRAIDETDAAAFALRAGEGVTVSSAGARRIATGQAEGDWTRGMLQFDGTPLADAVALANRYSTRRILLAPDLDSLRVSGAFRAGDTRGLAKALAAAFGLYVQQRTDRTIVLTRAVDSSPHETAGH